MQTATASTLEISRERWAELPTEARPALVRSDIYRALAWTFLFPEPAALTAVSRTISHVRERANDLASHATTVAALQHLEQFNHATIQQLSLEHDLIFGHTISADCPPYET